MWYHIITEGENKASPQIIKQKEKIIMSDVINVNELEQVAGGIANPDEELYITKQGDTLWSIAQERKTTMEVIFQRNKAEIKAWAHKYGKKSNNEADYMNWLWVGEKLYVPKKR